MTHHRNQSRNLKIKPGYWALSVAAALLLTGCGGGGTATTTAGATTTAAAGTPNGDTATATLNAALAKTYSLKFFKGSGAGCGTICSYTEGQSLNAVVGADGSLTIDTLKLSGPFYRKFAGVANTAEIIWLDGTANIEYALTNNNTATFNEINVGDVAKADKVLGVPGFVGQIR